MILKFLSIEVNLLEFIIFELNIIIKMVMFLRNIHLIGDVCGIKLWSTQLKNDNFILFFN